MTNFGKVTREREIDKEIETGSCVFMKPGLRYIIIHIAQCKVFQKLITFTSRIHYLMLTYMFYILLSG